jgi:hypothetical protein
LNPKSAVSSNKRPAGGSPIPHVSVIVPVMNERRTLGRVLREAKKVHPRTEIIVVLNGSRDGSGQIARRHRVRLLVYRQALGHDVGRAIGAEVARGDILLFLDGDIAVSARRLRSFVRAIERGADVALNAYAGPPAQQRPHPVNIAKRTLNSFLDAPTLGGASMTAIPHALSRRAVSRIGSRCLAVPPLAQARAVLAGLAVSVVGRIEVGKTNPRKARPSGAMTALILGDHLEAMQELIAQRGERGGFSDGGRRRDYLSSPPVPLEPPSLSD